MRRERPQYGLEPSFPGGRARGGQGESGPVAAHCLPRRGSRSRLRKVSGHRQDTFAVRKEDPAGGRSRSPDDPRAPPPARSLFSLAKPFRQWRKPFSVHKKDFASGTSLCRQHERDLPPPGRVNCTKIGICQRRDVFFGRKSSLTSGKTRFSPNEGILPPAKNDQRIKSILRQPPDRRAPRFPAPARPACRYPPRERVVPLARLVGRADVESCHWHDTLPGQ